MKSTEEIKKAVIEGIQNVTKKTNIPLNDEQTFESFGLDSLDEVTLMLKIEEYLDLDFGEISPDNFRTIQDYILYIQKTWPDA